MTECEPHKDEAMTEQESRQTPTMEDNKRGGEEMYQHDGTKRSQNAENPSCPIS
jgi:hypothetical protein